MACAPLAFEWNGDAFVPLRHCVGMANKEFVVHEVYRLAVHEERSAGGEAEAVTRSGSVRRPTAFVRPADRWAR